MTTPKTSIESPNEAAPAIQTGTDDRADFRGHAFSTNDAFEVAERNRINGGGLKRSEEKLQEEEYTLRQITDAIAQPLGVLNASGAVLYANQATLDYTGLSSEDLHQPNFRERMFHPEDLARLGRERKTALETGVSFEFEQRALRKDGQYRWFLIRYKPFCDDRGRVMHWYVAGADIDDLKRTEKRLRKDEGELRRIIDAIPQTIIVQDAKGIPLHANRSTLDYTGLRAEDVVGADFREQLFHPRGRREIARGSADSACARSPLKLSNAHGVTTGSTGGS